MKQTLRVSFINELPFMIQLPDDNYVVNINCVDGGERDFTINLNNNIFRLHMNQFANKRTKRWLDGDREEIEEFISNNRIVQYAIVKLKTYVSCTFENEFEIKEEMVATIDDRDIISELSSLHVRNARKNNVQINSEIAENRALETFNSLNEDEIQSYKHQVILKRELNKMGRLVYDFQNALNILIEQYRYIRNDIFVEPLTMHTLEGTYCYQYLNGNLIEEYKAAGKIPTIITDDVWMNEIDPTDLDTLKDRLKSRFSVPAIESLILSAENLLERGSFRSAVVEASAALEIAVENKITEKMKNEGVSNTEIDEYLAKTETNFYQRCDYQLKAKTSKSFVEHNRSLWDIINENRKTFRHKIVHSSLNPEPEIVNKIILDYKNAIEWVESL